MRGVLAKEWNVIQVKYEKSLDKKAGRTARTHSWNRKASKYLLQFSMNCWRHRCDAIHMGRVGTSEDVFRAQMLRKALDLQNEPWKLALEDRTLGNRNLNFFQKAKLLNLLMWKQRVEAVLVFSETKSSTVGLDLTSHFGPNCISSVNIKAKNSKQLEECNYESRLRGRVRKCTPHKTMLNIDLDRSH